jgi:hypothetical protein
MIFRIHQIASLVALAFATPLDETQDSSTANLGDMPSTYNPQRIIQEASAFGISPPLTSLPINTAATMFTTDPVVQDSVFLQGMSSGVFGSAFGIADGGLDGGPSKSNIPLTMANFEGIAGANAGGAVPPDTVGDVGPNHYVEMVNFAVAIYDKIGTPLLGPIALGDIWQGFAITDCAQTNGDPIVLHDQFEDRWMLTQFTTACKTNPNKCYNCVAISITPDPTQSYYLYAFSSQPGAGSNSFVLPDYPKYGVWSDSYVLTTADFEFAGSNEAFSGVSVYALEKDRMLVGDPAARAVQFVLNDTPPINVPQHFYGAGLLPADIDGNRLPPKGSPIPIIGSMDNDLGAPSDALNVWEFSVDWTNPAGSFFVFVGGLPTASFDSDFPCDPGDNGNNACIAQPDTTTKLDILSYAQRLLYRLAYRNFGDYESMVSTQSVEARPGIAGTRWYEIRRTRKGRYRIHQQGTFAPNDGVNRWMGSIAQDAVGNMAIGYSVSSSTVYPGIRYAGRLAEDAMGTMSLGEGTIINGGGSQTGSSRWGDYTSMNIDPSDDCTFWYANQYYATSSPANWQTRIASFTLPGCSDTGKKGSKSSKSDTKSDKRRLKKKSVRKENAM